MPGKQRWYRLGLGCLALLCLVQAGCLSFLNPLDPLPATEVAPQIDLPAASKNGVYIFFLHGVDPFDIANLSGVCDYVQSLGFIKTYYGLPFHAFYYETEIYKLRKKNPDARIVLVGFSYGGGLVHDLATSVGKQGIDVDLVVYLDRVDFAKRPMNRPENVRKVINILSFNRNEDRNLREGENTRYNDVWHFATVTHPQTLRMFTQELGEVAARVPVVTYIPPPIPGVIVPKPEQLPPPTPSDAVNPGLLPAPKPAAPDTLPAPKPAAQRGEWDFLKPDSRTGGVPYPKPTAEAFEIKPAALVEPRPE